MIVTERRRTDRLVLTIPLKAESVNGGDREILARTISINRHGALIQLPAARKIGLSVRLVNLVNNCAADFCIIERLDLPSDGQARYGVERMSPSQTENFWGVEFPVSSEGETAYAKGLLECRKCRMIALMPLKSSEVDLLRTVGFVAKPCEKCRVFGVWRYADVSVPVDPFVAKAQMDSAPDAEGGLGASVVSRRHRRIYIQLPLGIHNGQGGVEVTRTENLSPDGFCFTSEQDYALGARLTVVCPVQLASPELRHSARVVFKQPLDSANRKIYGARFDPLAQPLTSAA